MAYLHKISLSTTAPKSICNHIIFTPINVTEENAFNDEQLLDYIDISNKGRPLRVIGLETSALGQPSLIPLLSNADKVVLLISSTTNVTGQLITSLSAQHRALLKNTPTVICLFSKNSENQKEHVMNSLREIDITPVFSKLHPDDFKDSWAEILAAKKSEKIIKNTIISESVKQTAKVVKNGHDTNSSQILGKISQKNTSPKQSVQTENEVTSTATKIGVIDMANIKDGLTELMTIDGAIGCFLADYTSGMLLAKEGGGIDLDIAAAGNTEIIKAKMNTLAMLGLKDSIEDILVTLGKQYHLIRPMSTKPGLFLYVVLDKAKSNLAMARFKLLDVEKTLEI